MGKQTEITEQDAREVAEDSRQQEWTQPSFIREMFLGNLRTDLIFPYPLEEERGEFVAFYNALKEFLVEHVDSEAIDTTGEYPEEMVDGLRKLGAFGMKIPKEYGGLGFNQIEYAKVMELLGTRDGNVAALLSAHQSIGVPQPLKLFGTEEQKKEYLPRCARGEISAFALTEMGVGSDPARMATTFEETPEGDAYVLNGEKLWCTNGTMASLLVVMARRADSKKISAFVVETDWKGVKVEHRCHFMGLKALSNAVISFKDVRVPKKNLIGAEGRGLKIALTTLNDGRLSIPNGSVGTAKAALRICREWSSERVQWGRPVGKHEAVAHKIADMAATTYAMESVTKLATEMSNRGEVDIRLEAAAAKEWVSCRTWEIVDDTMQIRGGRGYETVASLKSRGEKAIPVERMMRDYRINKIFEGSSEIMHLFMAREAVDKHLQVAGGFIDPRKSAAEKVQALPDMLAFYASWYPSCWVPHGGSFSQFGKLSRQMRFVERSSRRLAREVFHGMVVHQAGLEKKQAFLFRLVDIANELFAMAASIARARTLRKAGRPEARPAEELTDLFCRNARRKVRRLFQDLWSNDDAAKYRVAQSVLQGKHLWLEALLEGLEETAPAEPAKAEPVPARPMALAS